MAKYNPLPPKTVVMEWLHYCPFTGVFTWMKEHPWTRKRKGDQAGSKRKTGYIYIKIGEHGILAAHRLAWLYFYNEIPDGMEIDHIDNNPSNNAISNLRLSTSSQQKQNRGVQTNNRSGFKGAYYHACHPGKKWRSQIKVDGRYVFLGYFHTAEEAHIAYCEAAPKYFGEFARVA